MEERTSQKGDLGCHEGDGCFPLGIRDEKSSLHDEMKIPMRTPSFQCGVGIIGHVKTALAREYMEE